MSKLCGSCSSKSCSLLRFFLPEILLRSVRIKRHKIVTSTNCSDFPRSPILFGEITRECNKTYWVFLSVFCAVIENFLRKTSVCFGNTSRSTSLDMEISARSFFIISCDIFLLPYSFEKCFQPWQIFNPHPAAIIYCADTAQRFFISNQVAKLSLKMVEGFFWVFIV